MPLPLRQNELVKVKAELKSKDDHIYAAETERDDAKRVLDGKLP